MALPPLNEAQPSTTASAATAPHTAGPSGLPTTTQFYTPAVYNPFRLSPLAAQVQLLQQSLFLSSEHLVSQRTQCEKISRSSSHFSLPFFFFLSSEHLVSQRTQCEKISRSSSHFHLSRFLFCPRWTVQRALVSQRRKKAQTLPIGRSKLQLLPVAGQQGPSVQAQWAAITDPLAKHPDPFSRYQPAKLGTHLGGF